MFCPMHNTLLNKMVITNMLYFLFTPIGLWFVVYALMFFRFDILPLSRQLINLSTHQLFSYLIKLIAPRLSTVVPSVSNKRHTYIYTPDGCGLPLYVPSHPLFWSLVSNNCSPHWLNTANFNALIL